MFHNVLATSSQSFDNMNSSISSFLSCIALYSNEHAQYAYPLSITDQTVPINVITPPMISVTAVSSINPRAIKIPPTNVNV